MNSYNNWLHLRYWLFQIYVVVMVMWCVCRRMRSCDHCFTLALKTGQARVAGLKLLQRARNSKCTNSKRHAFTQKFERHIHFQQHHWWSPDFHHQQHRQPELHLQLLQLSHVCSIFPDNFCSHLHTLENQNYKMLETNYSWQTMTLAISLCSVTCLVGLALSHRHTATFCHSGYSSHQPKCHQPA